MSDGSVVLPVDIQGTEGAAMIVIFLLIPISVILATGFLGAFIWAVRSGQYEDTCTPSMRLLLEERAANRSTSSPVEKPSALPVATEGPAKDKI